VWGREVLLSAIANILSSTFSVAHTGVIWIAHDTVQSVVSECD
jgi:hypothetical protein